MADIVDELRWRGLIAQTTDEAALRQHLNSGPVTFYCGFDPTAPSLHHGHLVALLVMRHLQKAGHRPLALVGGATGLIGDPREKGERVLNGPEVVAEWTQKLRSQIEHFLSFEGENAAVMVNNYDWTSQLSAIDLLRDLGKHFRLGTMISKDIVARRLNSDEGISYTEFSYQILQANDFLELHRRYGATLETGGNDQWGNLVGGVDLIRKVEGKVVHCMTNPLITKSDGTKFGKSEGGAVWLDPQMFSPYAFYQFWLNTEDADVVRFLKVFTFLPREEIEALEVEVTERPHLRQAQKRLAEEVTALVHGKQQLAKVQAATEALWGSGDLFALDQETLLSATSQLPAGVAQVGDSVVDALVACGLVKGKGEGRRLISSGGVSVNNVKVSADDRPIKAEDVLPGGVILLKKGRRNLGVVKVAVK